MPVAALARDRAGLGAVVDDRVADRADRLEGEEHRQHEAEVADAVGDEGLLAGRGRRRPGVPEGDQEVGARADALPAEERDEQVLAEHEHQHREGEQVEVQEELGELRVPVHVADRVEVDQRADAGDEQAHRDAQRVGEERHVDVQRPDRQPLEQGDDVAALVGRIAEQVDVRAGGHDERQPDHRRRQVPGQRVAEPPPQQQDQEEPHQRERRDQPDHVEHQPITRPRAGPVGSPNFSVRRSQTGRLTEKLGDPDTAVTGSCRSSTTS